MLEQLKYYDTRLLKFINHDLRNGFFDWLMPLLRNSPFWVPFYLFIILFVIINFKKTGYWFILFAILTAISSDLVSSQLIKQNIIRLRPCNDASLSSWLQVLVAYRPQSSSFTSSHAANHFSVAMILFLAGRQYFGKWMYLILFWAFSICYAQMYVGVHYPVDIICGAIIGLIIGYLFSKLFRSLFVLH